MHERPARVRARDQVGRRQHLAVRLVDDAVAVLVADRPVAVDVHGGRADDVGLPRADAVGVAGNLVQPGVRGEVAERAGQPDAVS